MLALDYRPFSWDAICGQKAIVSEMKKRSLKKDFPTVMFFAGDSGTGKTTMASIRLMMIILSRVTGALTLILDRTNQKQLLMKHLICLAVCMTLLKWARTMLCNLKRL